MTFCHSVPTRIKVNVHCICLLYKLHYEKDIDEKKINATKTFGLKGIYILNEERTRGACLKCAMRQP